MPQLQLGRAGEAIRGGILNFLEGGAPIRRGLAGLLEGDVEPLKQAVGYGQPFPQLTPEQMRQQAFDVAMDINNPMQNVGGLLGITAWHGSPHKFSPTAKNPLGEFDLNKMGTGEGAQVYGYGSYLSEAPEVAKKYAEDLTKMRTEPAQRQLSRYGGNVDEAISASKKEIDRLKSLNLTPETGAAKRDSLVANQEETLAELVGYKNQGKINQGYVYRVDLPDEYLPKMLDWDKPLGQQTPEVRQAITKIVQQDADGVLMRELQKTGMGETPGSVLYGILQDAKTKKAASEAIMFGQDASKWGVEDWQRLAKDNDKYATELLRQQGLLGLKYLDQGSRGAAQGTSNFVVFDPSILNILERQ